MNILNVSISLVNGCYKTFWNNIPETQVLDELNLVNTNETTQLLVNESKILQYFAKQGYTHFKQKGFNEKVHLIENRVANIKILTNI